MTDKPTILAVDDTSTVLGVLVRLLTAEGYQVRAASSGAQALAAVAASSPDLILLDVQMGEMDGTEVCRRIKANEHTRHIPIILISGYADVEDWVAGLNAGASDYITKPFQSEELLTRVRTHLALRRARLALEEEANMLLETTTRLEAEIERRQHVEDDLRQSLEQAERSRRALLSALEDQRLSEAALRASETKYRELTENLNDVVFTVTDDGVLSYVSPSIFAMSGYAPAELVGKPFTAFVLPGDLAELQQSMLATLGGLLEPSEFRCRTKDGRIRWVRSSSRPIVEGDRVTGLRGILSDITERREASDAQRAETERLRRVLGATSGGVWDWNIATGDAVFSPGYARMLGYKPAEFAESYKEWKGLVHPDDLERVQQAHLDHFHRNQEFSIEFRMREKSGAWHWIHSRGLLLERDSQGNPARMVGTHTDIQERKLAEVKRQELEAQLHQAQKMEAVGRLAGGVAHDFNNLLSLILNYTGFVMNDVPESDPHRKDLAQVQKAAERAAALTRQLLAFSRKQVMQPVALDLNQIARGMEKMFQRTLGEDVDFVQVLAADLGLTLADPGQLEQVLMNLVVNARDAMPDGGKLTIETANAEIDQEHAASLTGVKPGPYVRLAVTDAGCGMDQTTQARIFEPFFTTKEKDKGTGLGLSTVFGIVKQSGGDIRVTSAPGQGSRFELYLPRATSGTVPAAIDPTTTPAPVAGSETVLVVEDEAELRNVARRILVDMGYEVITAADGKEALRVCERYQGKIHLVLTDVIMPEIGGKALADRLAETLPGSKILFMSGYTDDAIAHHGVLDPGTHFIAKPFTAADLARKVRKVLDDGSVTATGDNLRAIAPAPEVKERSRDQAALRALPEDVRKRLHEAVIAARYDELSELVESIHSEQPELGANLRRLAERFDYDEIQELLR